MSPQQSNSFTESLEPPVGKPPVGEPLVGEPLVGEPVVGEPLLGALLRMPVDVLRQRMLDALYMDGFTDLIPPHLIVLRYPTPHGRRPVEIAAYSGFSKQALNHHLGQLESLGYLDRREDPEDRRFKRVYLTERGQRAVHTMRAAVTAVELEWAEKLGSEDIGRLREILRRLAAVLDPSAVA